jgi:hypothetical protein
VEKLSNGELNGLYYSPNIFRVIKPRRGGWAGHVARMERESVTLSFEGLDEERSLQVKGEHTPRIALSHFEYCCLALRNWKIDSDEQHAIFAQELQSALRLTTLLE